MNGVALPPAPPERPVASIETIPPGARINDAEIAAKVSMDLAAGLVACSQAMGQSLREDVGMMFGQFHMKKAQAGAILLRLNKKKRLDYSTSITCSTIRSSIIKKLKFNLFFMAVAVRYSREIKVISVLK